jgi:hypothetical protein
MRCSRTNRSQKCATRARWEGNREMRWDGWEGFIFPVTCDLDEEPTEGLVWKFCPACGGPLPLGMGPLTDLLKQHPQIDPPSSWQADGEGDE